MKASINADYDYSVYTNLKMVRIVGSHEEVDDLIDYFPRLEGTRFHQSIASARFCSEFLYDPQDLYNVIFQEMAINHYRRYPIETQYTHATDVFRKLQQMFKLDGKQVLYESTLYLATKRYLALVYKQLYGNETVDSLSKSQFAFLLPTFLEKDEHFINRILRPLLLEAGWISELDLKSKLVLFGELEAALYAEQQEWILFRDIGDPGIMREKKYMCCSIDSDWHSDSLTLTLDIVQMRFDKDFIAAFGSFISSSSTQLLTPQFVFPSKSIIIPGYVSLKTLQLPRFLLSKIFADSPKKITFIHGDLNGFYLRNKYFDGSVLQELIDKLVRIFFGSNIPYDLDACINKDYITATDLFQELDPTEKNNFAAIKYREILEYLPLVDMLRILYKVREYAKEHKLILHAGGDIIIRVGNSYYGKCDEIQRVCSRYQTLAIIQSIIATFISEDLYLFSLATPSFARLRVGILFKTLAMIELSNKLKEPTILKSQAIKRNLELMNSMDKTREETILEGLPGYSFYVEAKITTDYQIRLYLHQVIETQNRKEKSTLPIAETSIEIGSMYDTICDTLWNVFEEHSPLQCASALSAYDHHNNFRSRLLDFLTAMFNNEISKEECIQVSQNIHIGGAECSCCVQISHDMILDMGIKRYLKGIATSILACIKSPATFGKYNPKTIIITGSLLFTWSKINNTLYRYFIWNQLEEQLCLCIYQHQMKVHLIMMHTDLDLFPDDKLIKWEKYQQVIGDKRVLVDIRADAPGKLYRDEGDRYELIPAIKVDGVDHWRFHLIHSNDTLLLEQSETLARFYINPSKDSKERVRSFDDEPHRPHYQIEVYVCSSQDQEELHDPPATLKFEAITMASYLYLGPFSYDDFSTLPHTEFPIVFTIQSRNYDFKTKCSLLTGNDDEDASYFPGRITLKAIST